MCIDCIFLQLTNEEIQQYLRKVVVLLSYLQDKDVFRDIYKNMMAKRLLGKKSASDDMEKLMISEMKHDNGTTFTSHMEGMMQDLQISAEKNGEFSKQKYLEFVKNNLKDGEKMPSIDFIASVLTAGHWPSDGNKLKDLVVPSEMQQCLR